MRYREQNHYKNRLASFEFYTLPYWMNIKYKSDYLSLIDGKLVIKIGYAWDGASGPVFQTKALVKSALLHDAQYQIIRDLGLTDFYRKDADQMLRDGYLSLCLAKYSPENIKIERKGFFSKIRYSLVSVKFNLYRKTARIRAAYIYRAVRIFGGKHAKNPKKSSPIIIEV